MIQLHVIRLALCLALVALPSACTLPESSQGIGVSRGISGRSTQIVLLGTGNPNADPLRSGPAVAIVVNGTPYLIDSGPGVVRRAAAAHQAGIPGLEVSNLKRLFVTHLHSDHTLGYPDLILTPWVLGRDEPLEVYGPKGIAAMTNHILKAYDEDIRLRIDGLRLAATRQTRHGSSLRFAADRLGVLPADPHRGQILENPVIGHVIRHFPSTEPPAAIVPE